MPKDWSRKIRSWQDDVNKQWMAKGKEWEGKKSKKTVKKRKENRKVHESPKYILQPWVLLMRSFSRSWVQPLVRSVSFLGFLMPVLLFHRYCDCLSPTWMRDLLPSDPVGCMLARMLARLKESTNRTRTRKKTKLMTRWGREAGEGIRSIRGREETRSVSGTRLWRRRREGKGCGCHWTRWRIYRSEKMTTEKENKNKTEREKEGNGNKDPKSVILLRSAKVCRRNRTTKRGSQGTVQRETWQSSIVDQPHAHHHHNHQHTVNESDEHEQQVVLKTGKKTYPSKRRNKKKSKQFSQGTIKKNHTTHWPSSPLSFSLLRNSCFCSFVSWFLFVPLSPF